MKLVRYCFYLLSVFVPFVACPMDRAHALIDNIFVKVWHERGKLSITIGHGIFRSSCSFMVSDMGFSDFKGEVKSKTVASDSFADFTVSLPDKTHLCCDVLSGVLKVHVMRTNREDCSMLRNKLSENIPDKQAWLIRVERSKTIEIWRKIELRLESNLPVLYEGSFRSLIMCHPRYELKDQYLSDFSCEFCFLNGDGTPSPHWKSDLMRKKIPLFAGMVSGQDFLFERAGCSYQNFGHEFEECALFRKMTVSKDGKNISHAITIRNKEYRGFVLLRGSELERDIQRLLRKLCFNSNVDRQSPLGNRCRLFLSRFV